MSIQTSRPAPRFATALAALTLVAAAALPLSAGLIWLFWDTLAPLSGHPLAQAALGPSTRWAGFAVSLAAALIQAWGLLGLHRTFREAAARRPLSPRAVAGFRRFAWVSLAMVGIGILQHSSMSVLVSLADPTTPDTLVVRIGTPEMQAAFLALLLVFAAQVFAEGARAVEENAGFV
ncbi:MAG: hypothetical protein AAGE76_16245 [Pseudomonadota bacterium]